LLLDSDVNKAKMTSLVLRRVRNCPAIIIIIIKRYNAKARDSKAKALGGKAKASGSKARDLGLALKMRPRHNITGWTGAHGHVLG